MVLEILLLRHRKVGQMKVLVIDDSGTMRRIIVNTLKDMGIHNAKEAIDGEEGLKFFEEETWDLVITDWNMPGLSGLDVLREIRAKSDIPILMVTTVANKNDVIDALKAGVTNYVVKPMPPSVLKEKLEMMFPHLAKRH